MLRFQKDMKLPNGWKWKALSEVAVINPRVSKIDDDQEVTFLGMADVSGEGKVIGGEIKPYAEVANGFTCFEDGDVLVAKITPCFENYKGALVKNLCNGKGFGSTEFHVLRAKGSVIPEFLHLHTRTSQFRGIGIRNMTGTAGQKRVPTDFIRDWEIPLPPKPEQDRIAAILGTWDEAIAKTQALIERKERFRKNLSETLIECADHSRQELLEFVALRKDRVNPMNLDSETPCVELEHIDQGTGRILGTVDAREQASLKAVFEPGNVLFGKLRPYLRKFALPEFAGVCSTEIWVLAPNDSLCLPDYLFHLVQTERFIATACKTSGSKMPRADWELTAESPFPLPSLDEQRKISEVLNACLKEIELLTEHVEMLKHQKKGLMQKLLMGEWPVASAQTPQLQEAAG